MDKGILLSVTMLVSDREKTIEKCLESLAHLRETVPSELIVVDTAGNGACMEIVQKYADQIVRFAWCDDFSAARNAGLVKATGKWVMYLDDDEWFEGTEEIERFFLSGEYKKYHSASYLQRNYIDLSGSGWQDFDALRMAERNEKTHFIRKIHEQLLPCYRPTKFLSDYVHHYGYVFRSKEEMMKHAWRNIKPLQEIYREDPKDYHTLGQLVQEYFGIKEYFNALELCKDVWRRDDCWVNASNARYANYLIMMEMRIYILQGRYADGYEAGKAILNSKGLSVLARGIVSNQMTDICYRLGKYEEALRYSGAFFRMAKEWETVPNKQEQDGFSSCSPFLSSKEVMRHQFLQIHILVLQEDWQKAETLLGEIDWSSPDFCLIDETAEDILKLSGRRPYDKALFHIFTEMFQIKSVRPLIYQAFDAAEQEQKDCLMSYLCQLPPDDAKLCCLHIIWAGKQGDPAMAVLALEKMRDRNDPFFLADRDYWESLKKLDLDVNAYMTAMDSYTWMTMAERLWDALELTDCEDAYLCLLRGLEKTDLRYLYLSGLMREKELSRKEEALREKSREKGKTEGENEASREETEISPDELWDALLRMSQYWVACAAMLYREEVFLGDLLNAIPPRYRFGWYIMQANAVKAGNTALFVKKTADAAKAYPAMKELCKLVIRAASGPGDEKPAAAEGETL